MTATAAAPRGAPSSRAALPVLYLGLSTLAFLLVGGRHAGMGGSLWFPPAGVAFGYLLVRWLALRVARPGGPPGGRSGHVSRPLCPRSAGGVRDGRGEHPRPRPRGRAAPPRRPARQPVRPADPVPRPRRRPGPDRGGQRRRAPGGRARAAPGRRRVGPGRRRHRHRRADPDARLLGDRGAVDGGRRADALRAGPPALGARRAGPAHRADPRHLAAHRRHRRAPADAAPGRPGAARLDRRRPRPAARRGGPRRRRPRPGCRRRAPLRRLRDHVPAAARDVRRRAGLALRGRRARRRRARP